MRQTITILFVLIFCNVYGQKWHLNRIDLSAKFKYEYWFQFENIDDTSSYNLKKSLGQLKSTIQLIDINGNTVLFATIRVKGLDNDTLLNITSDLDGLGTVELRPGKYRIEVSAKGYDNFILDFTIFEGECFDLRIKLGLAPELTIYQINSMDELTEKEIQTIINCVKTNRQDYYKICSDKDRYNVIMHI